MPTIAPLRNSHPTTHLYHRIEIQANHDGWILNRSYSQYDECSKLIRLAQIGRSLRTSRRTAVGRCYVRWRRSGIRRVPRTIPYIALMQLPGRSYRAATLVLRSRFRSLPGECTNNSVVVGISSSPVLDISSTNPIRDDLHHGKSGSQVYRIHALDLETLADKIGAGVIVTASGVIIKFHNLQFQSRRKSSAFGASRRRMVTSMRDFPVFAIFPRLPRAVGCSGGMPAPLTPLAANKLLDRQASAPNTFFLSSIWMSGAGPGVDENGNLFLQTSRAGYRNP